MHRNGCMGMMKGIICLEENQMAIMSKNGTPPIAPPVGSEEHLKRLAASVNAYVEEPEAKRLYDELVSNFPEVKKKVMELSRSDRDKSFIDWILVMHVMGFKIGKVQEIIASTRETMNKHGYSKSVKESIAASLSQISVILEDM